MKEYLEIGEIVSLHGIKGAVKIYPWSDTPQVITRLKTLYLKEDGTEKLELTRASVQKNMILASVKGYEEPEQSRKLVGKTVYAKREDIPLPKGRMFIDDILGAEIIDAGTGKVYGVLKDVSSNGAHDIYHIQCGEKTVLFPAVDEFIDKIDAEGSAIYVKPIGGMFE